MRDRMFNKLNMSGVTLKHLINILFYDKIMF